MLGSPYLYLYKINFFCVLFSYYYHLLLNALFAFGNVLTP